MRKFKFFALAFAALSFAACSDDAIDGQGGNTGTTGDGTPAYLTISFSANSGSSSRAEMDNDGNNTGDNHGTAEDSGHENAGTADEIAVNRALVLVSPTTNSSVGFAKLYTATGDNSDLTSTTPDPGSPSDFVIVDNNSKTYRNGDPIRVATGTYNVLVVINPVDDLTDRLENMQLTSGPQVRELYNDILEGKYVTEDGLVRPSTGSSDEDTYVNDMGNGTDGFMMVNKSIVPVELTSSHTPDNPQTATVNVERVISKITFRETSDNIYPITVNTGNFDPITERGLIATMNGEQRTYEVQVFNQAHDLREDAINGPSVVYVLYEPAEEPNGTPQYKGVYRMTSEEVLVDITTDADGTVTNVVEVEEDDPQTAGSTSREELHVFTVMTPLSQTQYDDSEDKENSFVVDPTIDDTDDEISTEDILGSLTLQISSTTRDTWYVRLEGYALVNLSKEVHYVRHTTDGGNTPFGELNGSNFLYTPYFDVKNTVGFTLDNGFDDTYPVTDWFYNPLEDVAKESESLVITGTGESVSFSNTNNTSYYKPFSSLGVEGGDVTGDDHYNNTGENVDNTPAVGRLMTYCFENSTDINHQVHGLSTGVSFVARMYKESDCNENSAVERLYFYADHVYESLADIQEAYGVNTPAGIVDLINKGNEDAISDEDLEAVKIERYNDNVCYYYTSRIKHFDNGNDAVLGNMEYAIMRNNIYSIAVTNIRELGTPSVDPTPGIPNEFSEAALNIQVNMIPWIVRYNDIEF